MSQSKLIQVFVYGTLKTGQPNHHWLTTPSNGYAKFLCVGRTIEKLPLVIGTRYNIPFLLNRMNVGHRISGEIYEVDDQSLSNLDILEDYPKWYDRDIMDIETNDNGILPCWVYLLKTFPEQMLEKPFLQEYKDTTEFPYKDSHDESTVSDLMDEFNHANNKK